MEAATLRYVAPDLVIPLTIKPMEAEPVDGCMNRSMTASAALPSATATRSTSSPKKQKSLNRFFPEVVAGLARLKADRFVLDGELIIPGQPFETLQLRLHPAARRIAELSGKFPARLVVFDLPADESGSLVAKPFAERREALKAF
jgi:ATP dependent DNA ligase domain